MAVDTGHVVLKPAHIGINYFLPRDQLLQRIKQHNYVRFFAAFNFHARKNLNTVVFGCFNRRRGIGGSVMVRNGNRVYAVLSRPHNNMVRRHFYFRTGRKLGMDMEISQ